MAEQPEPLTAPLWGIGDGLIVNHLLPDGRADGVADFQPVPGGEGQRLPMRGQARGALASSRHDEWDQKPMLPHPRSVK